MQLLVESLRIFQPFHSSSCIPKPKSRHFCIPKPECDFDSLLHSATEAALLRFEETNRPDPLFVDLYAGCFANTNPNTKPNPLTNQYCLATKFFDEKLLQALNQIDGRKQAVLLTDGMDTRPYRLNWPISSTIYDISPDEIFAASFTTLEAVGAKTPQRCLFHHVPMEVPDKHEGVRSKGYRGNLPSVWLMQGFPLFSITSFEEIVLLVSSLAMKGSIFMGEVPSSLAGRDKDYKWIEKVFVGNNFRVKLNCLEEIAEIFGRKLGTGNYENVLFLAEQMSFSDDQMNDWREELHRMDSEGDEEGFDEL